MHRIVCIAGVISVRGLVHECICAIYYTHNYCNCMHGHMGSLDNGCGGRWISEGGGHSLY